MRAAAKAPTTLTSSIFDDRPLTAKPSANEGRKIARANRVSAGKEAGLIVKADIPRPERHVGFSLKSGYSAARVVLLLG